MECRGRQAEARAWVVREEERKWGESMAQHSEEQDRAAHTPHDARETAARRARDSRAEMSSGLTLMLRPLSRF